ncbi:hypothetical protein Tco_0632962 [Tanacetum coccineum]
MRTRWYNIEGVEEWKRIVRTKGEKKEALHTTLGRNRSVLISDQTGGTVGIATVFDDCTASEYECDVGKKINEHQEKERLYEVLIGLDAKFIVIRTQILATKPVPSLGTTYHMVAEDERQRAVSNENINPHESTAFKAFQSQNGPPGSNKERSGTKL